MDINVESWWYFLSFISVFNITAWVVSLAVFQKNIKIRDSNIYVSRLIMIWCSGIYVAGCAFRSFFPRIDLERICLVDSVLSNMFIGRSVATVAELCFIIQSAILLHEAAKGINDRFSIVVSKTLVPAIILAECFSWYAMLSTNNFGSVIEESIWTVCGILLVICLFILYPHVKNRHKSFLTTMIVFGIGFIAFMIMVDVPMYITRWLADTEANVTYLTLTEGLTDSVRSCAVSFEPENWNQEIPWMTLYFTVAVWVSIALPLAPNYKKVIKKRSRANRKKRHPAG